MSLTLLDSGAIAWLIKTRALFLLVGRGAGDWPATPPPMPRAAVALVDPVALVRLHTSDFVVEDQNGVIATESGGIITRWTVSAQPSAALKLDFLLALGDLGSETLREMIVVIDPELAAGVPPGQRIIPLSSVVSFGRLLAGERTVPLERTGTEEIMRYVITP